MFNRFINTAFIVTAFTLVAGWANASDKVCSIVVINGDTVISCPKAPVVCTSRPLLNGRIGERVMVCDKAEARSN